MNDEAKRRENVERIRADLQGRQDYVSVSLLYPKINPVKAIHVGMMDVRAADDIRIEYDYMRDGWVIKQAQVFSWEAGDELCDAHWKEVAFVQAWASQIDDDEAGAGREEG